jgi:hypothetical protein
MDEFEQHVADIVKARNGANGGANGSEPVKPKRAAHLKPAWAPGVSGNPSGKAPGTISLRAILKAKLAEIPEGRDRRTIAEQLVDQTCKAALHGDAAARKLVWESIEGTARQQIDVGVVARSPYEDMTEAELDAEYQRVKAALRAADHRTATEIYAAEAAEIEPYVTTLMSMTGCYCDRPDCPSRLDGDEASTR